MRHQPLARPQEASRVDTEPATPFIADSHRLALEQLERVFRNGRPLATLIGEGKSGSSYIIRRFLGSLPDDVVIVRMTEPCADAAAVMRTIIESIGFEPKDMGSADLENILTLFLSHQRTHHLRTIICIEEAQDSGWWVLDKVRRLVELETEGKFGMTVILSGRPGLSDLFLERPLSAISEQDGPRIMLAPFTLAETTEYIRRRVELAGNAEISQVFEYHAITLLHELSGGVPDTVSELCSKCFDMMDDENKIAVTTDLVKQAHARLKLGSMVKNADAEVDTLQANDHSPRDGRLIACVNGVVVQELTLTRGHILIGRDELCDIRLTNRPVSRHHALVVDSPIGVKLLDLGSTNGTFVEGRPIKQYSLRDGDVIEVGDCTIEYIAGENRVREACDVEPTDSFMPHKADGASNGQGNSHEMRLLQPAETEISPAVQRARH